MIGNQILGLIVLGDHLDSNAAATIREVTGRDVLVLRSGQMIAQSRENPESLSIVADEVTALVASLETIGSSEGSLTSVLPRGQNQLAQPYLQEKKVAKLTLGKKACLAVAVPFSTGDGSTILFRELDEWESWTAALRGSILGAGGISVILAVILSLWLSVRVSQPIRDLGDDGENLEIIQTIATLAHNLGMEVT